MQEDNGNVSKKDIGEYAFIFWASAIFNRKIKEKPENITPDLRLSSLAEEYKNVISEISSEEALDLIIKLRNIGQEIENENKLKGEENNNNNDEVIKLLDKTVEIEENIDEEDNEIIEEDIEEEGSMPIMEIDSGTLMGISNMFMREVSFFRNLHHLFEEKLISLEKDNILFSPPLINTTGVERKRQSAMINFLFISDSDNLDEAETEFWNQAKEIMDTAPNDYGYFEIMITNKILVPKKVAYDRINDIKKIMAKEMIKGKENGKNNENGPSMTLV